jgi:predicted metal-dependent phosphoesterase TrpH
MKFDMHCHTKEGSMDGKVMIEEYIKSLKEKGFGGMLVSDHNSYDGYREWRDSIKGKRHTDFVVLKGVEYDTIDCGHMLVIMPQGVKLKLLELRGLPAQILLMTVHHYGGIVGPAHPFGEKYLSLMKTQARKKFYEERVESLMHQFDFVEIYNACEAEEVNEKAALLARKYHKPGFGGSDAHRVDCIGMGYTKFPDDIRCENDLIAFVKKTPYISCGGTRYERTTKDKLGPFNKLLVESFFLYNKSGERFRRRRREKELENLH